MRTHSQNENGTLQQQLGRLRIPKVLFLPGEPMAKQRIASLPSSPVKGITNQIDIQEKLKILQAEREAKQKLQEQEMFERDKRCTFNRQAHIINKLHNVEQQLEKWKKTRHNIQFVNKTRMSQVIESQQKTALEFHRSIQQRNKSYSEFEQKNVGIQINEVFLKRKDRMRERSQMVNQTRYKNYVDQIDKSVRIMQKKYKTQKKCFTLRKPFYNINELKNYSHFLLF
ncbi:unnamed protein product [Paramecium sonneborni]|uniref:Uncharacterized protein n=1 Tax=Paramecium sonneborni TaxID=65129 RepID=A0A8S1PW21_9CILI|nr:unnamed protein product [Paramecium sonneborni]CAD8107467.1 unnamed protein product [Paramecium sonneborni]